MRARAFSLIEMMAVVMIILLITAMVGLTFANSRPSVEIKRDAAKTVAFLRNMWDRARASAGALILEPDFEEGTLSYVEPRSGQLHKAEFDSGAHVVGIRLNDKVYNSYSNLRRMPRPEDEEIEYDPEADVLFISENRGLVRVTVIFAKPIYEDGDDELIIGYEYVMACTLNLINGKSRIERLEDGRLAEILEPRMEVYDENI